MGGGVDGGAKGERHPYRATGYSVADKHGYHTAEIDE